MLVQAVEYAHKLPSEHRGWEMLWLTQDWQFSIPLTATIKPYTQNDKKLLYKGIAKDQISSSNCWVKELFLIYFLVTPFNYFFWKQIVVCKLSSMLYLLEMLSSGFILTFYVVAYGLVPARVSNNMLMAMFYQPYRNATMNRTPPPQQKSPNNQKTTQRKEERGLKLTVISIPSVSVKKTSLILSAVHVLCLCSPLWQVPKSHSPPFVMCNGIKHLFKVMFYSWENIYFCKIQTYFILTY